MQVISSDLPNLKHLIESASADLKGISHSPRLDVELLLAHVLDVKRSYFISYPEEIVSTKSLQQFSELLTERKTGKPIAYLLGKKGFWTFDLLVNENTLVPRPETELLVEQALQLIPEASERPKAKLHATDIDKDALYVAQENKHLLNLNNVYFHSGDLYLGLPKQQQRYDMIVSNPPYIDKDDNYLTHPTMQHEPRHALIADNNGLAIIERLLERSNRYLKSNGYLLLEHGHEQKQAIKQLAKQHHLKYILGCQDYQALDRISILQNTL